jgi:hypothetical protein
MAQIISFAKKLPTSSAIERWQAAPAPRCKSSRQLPAWSIAHRQGDDRMGFAPISKAQPKQSRSEAHWSARTSAEWAMPPYLPP